MSIKGFSVGGVVQRYDYTALDNLPQGQGVSDDLKAALLQLARKVAYIDDQGQTYYDDLYDALYPEKTLLSITANFGQGQAVIYNTDSLDTLKQYLTVTAVYDDASTETVPSSAYTLSGTLTPGTSVITVTYDGKTDAFNVTVTAAPMSFPVTNNLTGCTTSNSASNVADGSTYSAVITASSDYTLVGATVSITMGGQDITTSAYSGGVITISNVNGALIISVTAVEIVLTSISAVYTQSGTVYDTDTLDSLKADLVVTAHYSDSSTQTIPAADYTLSGTLTAGTSIITVSYGGKTTTFSVTVTHAVTMFSVTNTLTNITSSNSATSIAEGEQYAATLTADEGYAIASVTITMGGTDITSTAYSDGVITIASVNGDISITATAAGSIDVQSLLLAHGYYYDGYTSTLGGGASWTHYGTSVDGGTTPAYAIQLEQGKTYTVSTAHNANSGTYLPVAFAGATDGSVGPSGGSGVPGRNNIAKISTIQSTMTSEQIASGVYKLTWTFTCGRTTAYMSVGCLKNYKSYASVTFTD